MHFCLFLNISGGFPTFVIKADSESLVEDLEYLLEERFGIDDVEFPLGKMSLEPTDEELRSLYGQLTEDELEALADFFRVDLDMYDYSYDDFRRFVSKI